MAGFFGAVGILVISKLGGYTFDNWMPSSPFLLMALANALLLIYAFWVRVRWPRERASI
jgi:predicted MFS family arabinose efflux permease